MTKSDFLEALKEKISDMPFCEVEKTIHFYSENIDDRMEDGICEEDAVAALGDLNRIAQEIRSDLPIATLITKKVQHSRNKASNKTVWVVLAICGSPIWFPLCIAFAAVVLALYVTLWALIFSLYAALFSFALGSVAGILLGFIRIFMSGFWAGIFIISLGICCAGIFMMSVKPMFCLFKKAIKLAKWFMKRVKSLFVPKEVSA